ncbi:MAG: hypothetical protein WCN92_00155 [Eubacteriales bacterium]
MANNNQNEGVLTQCGGKCGYTPTIIIPGIGQSKVFRLDDNGNRMKNEAPAGINFPVSMNTHKLIKTLALPVLKMIFTHKDKGFTNRASKAIGTCFLPSAVGINGKPVNNLQAEKYLKSAARCTEEERAFIYSCIPLAEASEEAGDDHIYFLGFNSFGNNLDTAAELYEMIQLVKKETGHDKVNIVPISLGGTIAVSLLHFYPQVSNDLDKIVFIVPGLDGTKFFADIYGGNFNTDEDFYRKSILSSAKGFKRHLLGAAMILVPKGVIVDLLRKTFDEIRNILLLNSTVMWGSVPCEDYQELADKLLSDDAHAEIHRQTDLFHEGQANMQANIIKFIESGVRIFDIVDYNHPLHKFVNSSKNYNGDGWVNIESASLGATSGLLDQPLPTGYVQQNAHCSNPAHNHLSPDGIVDASTGILPETTFYFRNQDHELTAENDVIIRLVSELLLHDEIKNVFSQPDKFPQFNTGRATGHLRNTLLPKAASIDSSKLSAADSAELLAAVNECKSMLAETIVDAERAVRVEERLKKILSKIGAVL